MIRIAGLFIYPIKGCGGYSLGASRVVPGGLEHDRRYMIVDASGRMVTRREEVRLAQLSLSPQASGFVVAGPPGTSPPLHLPPSEKDAPDDFSSWVESSVWRDQPRARMHVPGSEWLTRLLGRDLRLVYLPEESLRQVNPARAEPGDLVSFADGYPILLTSESSLEALNSRLDEPIGMERFRPNVVVSGSESFAEDTWAKITLGGIFCALPKLCDRCVVTTVSEGSGEKGKEPLKTLARFRRWDGAVWFGTNVIPRGAGVLQVGDSVSVDEVRPHPSQP